VISAVHGRISYSPGFASINSWLVTADLHLIPSNRRSTTNSSVLILDQPVTSSASISIAIDRLASFTCLNNNTILRQYLIDLTWSIAILLAIRCHPDFDPY